VYENRRHPTTSLVALIVAFSAGLFACGGSIAPGAEQQQKARSSVPSQINVPLLSQCDSRWKSKTASCNGSSRTICSFGCAVTSEAMIYQYYGGSTTPDAHVRCLGSRSCPLYWGNCKPSGVTYKGSTSSRSTVDRELSANRPVIAKLTYRTSVSGRKCTKSVCTHFVVIVGKCSDGSYRVNDPGVNRTGCMSTMLPTYSLAGQYHMYSGTPSYGSSPGGGATGGGGSWGSCVTSSGQSGVCQDTSTPCAGGYQSNLCPGPSNIKCCIGGSAGGHGTAPYPGVGGTAADTDRDGIPDIYDNCPTVYNADQRDSDGDRLGDACDQPSYQPQTPQFIDSDYDGLPDLYDNCPMVPNPDQRDSDNDRIGDACDQPSFSPTHGDIDFDGVPDAQDNCPSFPNPDQRDQDGDGTGDICDHDADGDQSPDTIDNCRGVPNLDQKDTDGDGIGDACDSSSNPGGGDRDGDGYNDSNDNCPNIANPSQADFDRDGQGDACDSDDDNDGVMDLRDNCPHRVNADQRDSNNNGRGDACEPTSGDSDGDGIPDGTDRCPNVYDPNQTDTDGDGHGDLCDSDDDGDAIPDHLDNCPAVYNPDQRDSNKDRRGDACAGASAGGAVSIEGTASCSVSQHGRSLPPTSLLLLFAMVLIVRRRR
jgi:hypothetical protein